VTIDAAYDSVEAEPEEPKRPPKKWMIFLGCVIGVFALLAAYDAISGGLLPGGGKSAAPAATHRATASPSAASPIATAPATSASPSSAASVAQHPLAVSAIAAFGPDGTSDGDHPGSVADALDDGAQPWDSSWYLSPEFGNLQAGTGLLLDMGKSVTVSSVQLVLGVGVGTSVQVRVGDTAVLDDLSVAATATDVGGTVRLAAATPASGRYVLIWFTALPPIGQGRYQVDVYDATVDGAAGT
jgi:hypothetical protein